jgi:3-oxoacyl-[acyl-carrier-protein] synthase II
MGIHKGVVPPTLNLERADVEGGCDLDYVPNVARNVVHGGLHVALTNSFGFGGTNVSLCFSKINL